jgi:hypothetical protein
MFAAYCPKDGSRVLLGLSRIRGVTNHDGVIDVELECYDGERIHYYTGKRLHESLS